MVPLEIAPAEVKRRMDALTLIDVREPAEHEICQIPGARLIPMRSIPEQFNRLEAVSTPLVIVCHHGVRSLRVVEWLREQGLDDCQSMAGGIEAWSLTVDPSVPRY